MSQFDHGKSAPPPGGTKLVIIAVGMAVLSVILTNWYIDHERKKVAENSFTVYVLTKSVLPGYRLQKNDYKPVQVQENFREAFSSALDERGIAVKLKDGDPFLQAAAKGDILSYKQFRSGDDETQQDHRITMGKRLVSLPINSRLQPGMLRPGMYVDIAAPFQTSGDLPEPLIVMEYIRVLAVGRSVVQIESDSGRAPSNYQTITIELTPDQARIMSMVQKMAIGEFDLYVRNPGDTTLKLKEVDFDGINRTVVREIEKRIGKPFSGGE